MLPYFLPCPPWSRRTSFPMDLGLFGGWKCRLAIECRFYQGTKAWVGNGNRRQARGFSERRCKRYTVTAQSNLPYLIKATFVRNFFMRVLRGIRRFKDDPRCSRAAFSHCFTDHRNTEDQLSRSGTKAKRAKKLFFVSLTHYQKAHFPSNRIPRREFDIRDYGRSALIFSPFSSNAHRGRYMHLCPISFP